MNLTKASLSNPYGVIAFTLVIVVMGLFAFFRTPTDLFPDTAPPQVAVITVQPGGSAKDIADKITQILEKELNSITGLKRIRSTSRDEVSSVVPEFFYTKSVGEAVTDVQNAVARVRARLPQDILEPMIYRITDATKPLLTLALSPLEGSPKDLSVVRLLAENQLADMLLRIPGVGDVDVFGANNPEIQVRVDRDKLAAQGLTLGQVLGRIQTQNVAAPAGTIYTDEGEYLVRVLGEFRHLDQIRNLPVAWTGKGRVVLRDLADVQLTRHEPRSVYRGNGREAIAVNIMRPEGGETVGTIQRVKRELETIRKRFPDILFDITNDQQPIIDVNVQGMRSSVYQAVLLTVAVILIFLADGRAALTVSLGIPLSFLAALAVLWFSPYTLNMVTLSGLVIAVGLVLDAAIVVLENIYRHHEANRHPDAQTATLEGTNEVMHGIVGGMLTTVVVLVPVMFAGGYTQQVMRPLNLMISSTIIASLVISTTVIPLLASRVLGRREGVVGRVIRTALSPFGRWVDRRAEGVTRMTRLLLRHRGLTLLGALAFLVFSMRIIAPMNGRELMPHMDTGIGIISFDAPTHYTPAQVGEVAARVEAMVRETSEGLKWISTTIGSEPGEISFGGGGETAQAGSLMITLVDRKHRKASIWELQDRWREKLRALDGVRTFHVTEFGATPLSTTRAPLDLVISGPDFRVLDKLADDAMGRLRGVQGLADVRRSWYFDKQEQNLVVDPDLAALYGLSPRDVAQTLKAAVKGVPAGQMSLEGALDIPIVVKYRDRQMDAVGNLEDALLPSSKGMIPVRAVAKVSSVRQAPFITRQALFNTIDVTGINNGRSIADVGEQVREKLKGLQLPSGYRVEVSGSLEDMKTVAGEMGRALLVGIVMLYIVLVTMFKSFSQPITILSSVLFSVAAAMWGLLIFHKPMCQPAMMGIILLSGTVVNNVILVIDFIEQRRAAGASRDEAIVEAIRLRFRPILMTALSAAIGLSPLVFEMAVGMERLSPLGIVAAVGLLAGVFISTMLIPVVYSLVDSAGAALRRKPPKGAIEAGAAVLLVLGVVAAPGIAGADETNGPAIPMTREQAVRHAMAHSPALRMAEADAAEAQGNHAAARAGLLPQVELIGSAAFSDLEQPVLPGLAPAHLRFSDTRYQAGVQINQLLWDFGQTWNRMRAARDLAEAELQTTFRKRQEVAFTVSALYHQRLMLDDFLSAAAAAEISVRTLVSNIHARVASGRGVRLDELKANVRLAAIKSQIATLEAQRTSAQSVLLATLGYEEAIAPSWVVPDEPTEPAFTDLDTAALVSRALAARQDLMAQQARIAAAEAGERGARRSRWPRIGLFGQYAEYGAEDPAAASPTGNNSDGWEDNWIIGVAASMPLLDSGLRSGTIAAARARLARAEAAHDGLRLRVQSEVASAVAEIQSARTRRDALRQSVIQSRQALQDEKLKYEAGKGTVNDVLEAEAVLLVAESQHSRARHEEAIARYNLQLATAQPLTLPPPPEVGP